MIELHSFAKHCSVKATFAEGHIELHKFAKELLEDKTNRKIASKCFGVDPSSLGVAIIVANSVHGYIRIAAGGAEALEVMPWYEWCGRTERNSVAVTAFRWDLEESKDDGGK